MSTSRTRRSKEEIQSLGEEVFERIVRPKVSSEDEYKFLAIDIETADFEIDDDDYTAVTRLLSRNPEAEIWLRRVGYPWSQKIRGLP